MPRKSSQGHRTEITVAIIAMISVVLVAFIANIDKIFGSDPAPPPVNQAQAQPPSPQPAAPQPVAGLDAGTMAAGQNLSEAERQALDRYANSINDITRQIDAQNANLQ